jgi:transposase InsO family protein
MTGQWIDLDEAALRSGKSRGHLQRVASDLLPKGLARKERPAGGGKARWEILESAGPEYALVKMPEQLGTDLGSVSESKRKEALRRIDVINRWEQHCRHAFAMGFDRDAATGHFLERELIERSARISRATLYNWHKAYRAQGLAGLVDGRGVERAAVAKDDPFLKQVERFFVNRNRPKLSVAYRMALVVAAEQQWQVTSYKTAERHVKSLHPGYVKLKREGEEAYVNDCEPFVQRDYTTLAANDIWCGDHHQFDVVVLLGERKNYATGEVERRHGRPWITAWMDVRSRKIVGWTIFGHDPNQDTVIEAFRRGITSCGVPLKVYIDNGKDFDSYALHGRTKKDRWAKRRVKVQLPEAGGIFGGLNVGVMHALPYHGQSKVIERWFGTLELQTVCWDTYCGNSPATRRDDLQLQIDRGKAPTLAEFAAWADAWIAAYNARHEHQGQGMDGRSPDAVYAATQPATIRTLPTLDLHLLTLKPFTRKVGQNGVTHEGITYGQYEPALQKHYGQEVLVRVDDRDASQVIVHDITGRTLLCIAKANRALPVDARGEDVRQAHRAKGAIKRTLRQYVEQAPRRGDDIPDLMIRAAMARQTATTPIDPDQPPPIYRPLRHAMSDAMADLQRAIEAPSNRGQIAVGAEAANLDDLQRAFDRADASSAAPAGDPMEALRLAFKDTDQ